MTSSLLFVPYPLPDETEFGCLLRFRKFGQRNTRAAHEEEEASAFLLDSKAV